MHRTTTPSVTIFGWQLYSHDDLDEATAAHDETTVKEERHFKDGHAPAIPPAGSGHVGIACIYHLPPCERAYICYTVQRKDTQYDEGPELGSYVAKSFVSADLRLIKSQLPESHPSHYIE